MQAAALSLAGSMGNGNIVLGLDACVGWGQLYVYRMHDEDTCPTFCSSLRNAISLHLAIMDVDASLMHQYMYKYQRYRLCFIVIAIRCHPAIVGLETEPLGRHIRITRREPV